MLNSRVKDCMWMRCIYGGICSILDNSLSFMLTIADKIFCRLFVRRELDGVVHTHRKYSFTWFCNLTMIMCDFTKWMLLNDFRDKGFNWLIYFEMKNLFEIFRMLLSIYLEPCPFIMTNIFQSIILPWKWMLKPS